MIDIYKTVTVETLEVEKRNWFKREVSIIEIETKHKLKPTNLDFGYKYSFKRVEEPESNMITEHYIVKLDNIYKIYYNKEIQRFTIFFKYDISDYVRLYNEDETDKKYCIDTDDVTELDLDEYMELDNIFSIDLIKYFERNQININYNKEELEKEIKAFKKRHKEKVNNKIRTTRKSIKINKIN